VKLTIVGRKNVFPPQLCLHAMAIIVYVMILDSTRFLLISFREETYFNQQDTNYQNRKIL